MYRDASVGLFGLPSRPFGWARTVNQFTAFTSWSLYFPSRRVLPSISMAIAERAVMVVGYWSPWAPQWPSGAWFRLSHSSPFSTIGSTSCFFPAGGAAGAAAASTSSTAEALRVARVMEITPPAGRVVSGMTTHPPSNHGRRTHYPEARGGGAARERGGTPAGPATAGPRPSP